jgi:hypothetical protein
VTSDESRPLGIAVVRVWFERGSRTGLRVRITESPELSDRATSKVVASADEAGAAIRDFVARMDPDATADGSDDRWS